MKVNTVVEQAAEVVRIVRLSPGDCYKRLHTPSYGEPVLRFGVVQDVMDDGETVVMSAVEFTPGSYSGSEWTTEVAVHKGDADLVLYPATVEEVTVGMRAAIESQQVAVESARRTLTRKEDVLRIMVGLVDDVRAPLTETRVLAVES